MAIVRCGDARIELADGERVLDGLLRAGVPVPSSCRAGACQACLVRAVEGVPPPAAQVGLNDTMKAQGYFLACSAQPSEDLTVALLGASELGTPASIVACEALSGDVTRVLVTPEKPLDYRPGQFVTLVRDDGLARSYSLASHPEEDNLIELHVRRLVGGRMSQWLSSAAAVDARIELRGPSGSCFYAAGNPERPLLLAGTGTGLAPLWGILRDALRAGHTGAITIAHGGRSPDGLYLVDQIRDLAAKHPNVTYMPCVLEGGTDDTLAVGALDAVVGARFPSLAGHRAYLCGDPDLVARMRKRVFLAGARLTDIFSDAFVTASAPSASAA